ncbi:nitrate ABC transporter ATP-binding protein [Thermostichus sp. OS-CIW-30]
MTALLTTSTPANVAAEPYLSLENVSKTYSTPKGDYPVLRDINLSVNEGEFVCLVGHSGCGKTTLLNMVSGFAQPTSGSVKLKGQPITAPGPERMVVFQGYALLPWLTVYENVYLAVRSVFPQKSQSEKHQIVEEHLDLVGLGEAAQKYPSQISGGMKQRVAIARALAIRPEVLILDEPFGALDAITKEELQEELLRIWDEHRCTVLMITHDIDEALFLADRLVLIAPAGRSPFAPAGRSPLTNGPAATIGQIVTIPFPRPRDRERILEDPQYYRLRNSVLSYLYGHEANPEAAYR